MPQNFWSKISVESQDSRFDGVEVAQEGIVPLMVEQTERNSANKFDDFQALIKEMKSQSLMISQRLEAQMAEQAKATTDQTKVIVEGLKQQSQSQVKLFEAISGVMGRMRQHRYKFTNGPAKKLSNELRGQ